MGKRTRNRFIALLRQEIGYYEKASNAYLDDKTANAGSNNYTKYSRDLAHAGYYQASKQGFDWCDVFYDWVFLQLCGGDADEAQRRTCQSGPYGAGVDWSASYYKQAGRFYTSNPRPGDQIFFRDFAHTGAVEEVTATQIITIEGNANNRVERRYYPIGTSCIDGFGRPEFDEEAEDNYTEAIRGVYQITANGGLNLRSGPASGDSIRETMPNGGYAKCYGYFSGEWYYVQSQSGTTGYCHKDYLKKVLPFIDVVPSRYYFDSVRWALDKGITNGTSPDTFSPNAKCNRAQAVTMLYRTFGGDAGRKICDFDDVAENAYYAEAVKWAASRGITNGVDDNEFAPDDPCTRAQAITMLYRAAGSPAVTGKMPFVDVKADIFYASAVRWAVSKGITKGDDATHFAPNKSCTRADMVTFLYRSFK